MRKLLTTYLGLTLIAASMVAAPAAQAQDFASDGWWVVMAAFKENAANRDASEAKARNKAAQCGVEAFNDFSNKFDGFAPGLTVVVSMGAYTSKAQAQAALAQVQPCIPDAYLKKARYAGE